MTMSDQRVAFVCPGQGSQRPQMLEAVPENDALDRLIDAAEALSGMELRAIAALGAAEELADTRVAQPLLYLTDWAWGVALLEVGVEPVALAGHSLGEFAALALAGVYSVEAGLELVVERSKLMATTAASTPGGMAAVLGMPAADVARVTEGVDGVWTANDNAPSQVVISGTEAGLDAATEALQHAGARRIVPLKVAGPFHSPLMEPARAAFEELLATAELRDATIPVVQNTAPALTTDAETIRRNLATQITAPVRWTETMRALASDGPVTLLETGPGNVLSGLARGVDDVTAVTVDDADLQHLVEEVLR